MLKKLLVIQLVLVMLTIGCSTKKAMYTDNADDLYNQAMNELNSEGGGFPWILNDRNYDKIFGLLKEIQLRHSFSPYATLAELRTGDAYYKKEEYKQSVIEYQEFLKRHPGHKESQHALYYLAMSYYNLRKSPDRDPTYVRNALDRFLEYQYKYPDSDKSQKVEKRIMNCKNILAKREIYIGDFYNRHDNYKAAYERYKNVLDKYPDTKYVSKAKKKMEKAGSRISKK